MTNGSYHQAADAAGLTAISRRSTCAQGRDRAHRGHGIFAAAAALLLVAGALLSVLWFGRVV